MYHEALVSSGTSRQGGAEAVGSICCKACGSKILAASIRDQIETCFWQDLGLAVELDVQRVEIEGDVFINALEL